MARNANNQPSSGGSDKVEQDHLDGTFPARIVQVVFLGIQEQRAFQGNAKPPIDQVRVTYELSHEFMKDENGEVQADKPRWYSEQIAFHNAEVDLATSTKRYKAYVPTVSSPSEHEWGENLLGRAVQVQLKSRQVTSGKSAGRTFTDVKGVTAPANMPGYVQPALVNDPVFFDPADDDASVEVFNSFPQWLQDVIKGAKDFSTSGLCRNLAGSPPAATPPTPAPQPAPQADLQPSSADNPY